MVFGCMLAILEGPFIDDSEFHARLGLERHVMRDILSRWPILDDEADESPARLAINNCMNEVCHGVRISAAQGPLGSMRQ